MSAPTGRRVLLVEDDAMNRMTLGFLLEDSGYRVVPADSLAAARPRLGEGPYDLAILDLHLGDGLGTALIPDLRAHHPEAVVAVLSGSVEVPSPEQVDLLITKGADPDRLLRQLEAALVRRAPGVG